MDLRDYYDNHWSHVPEGNVDYTRLQYVLDALEPGERVLDSGCGPGFLAALLAENGIDVVGTDVSAVGPERTRRRGIPAQQVDLDTDPLPFGDGEFDAVVANSNLEHLFYIHRHIKECVRCVKPGGKFIWLVPNIGHWHYRWWLMFGRFPYIANAPSDPYHIRYMTAYEAKKLLQEAGLEGIRLRGHAGTWCRGLYPKLIFNRRTKKIAPRLYEPLVKLNPSLFARYLCFYAVKGASA
ncbi:MAG TPA: class I SAM-dependent methyltransferase [Gaiellaceae bacterium]|nr:class I SAM-dependent methyltransferase [Gaiellaceae bacterium]